MRLGIAAARRNRPPARTSLRRINGIGGLGCDMNVSTATELVKETYTDWSKDKATRLAAAFAYYTIFSIAPLLIVVLAIAGLVFGQLAAHGKITEQIQQLVGPAS